VTAAWASLSRLVIRLWAACPCSRPATPWRHRCAAGRGVALDDTQFLGAERGENDLSVIHGHGLHEHLGHVLGGELVIARQELQSIDFGAEPRLLDEGI
jgi:hypothetical protein